MSFTGMTTKEIKFGIYFFLMQHMSDTVNGHCTYCTINTHTHSMWNISADDEAFSMHKAFVETVATTTWSNLKNFARFVNDSEQHFKGVDMRQLAFMVKKKHFHFRLSHFDKFEHEKMNSV